jgi:transglutaminase-like putative cysteine protease
MDCRAQARRAPPPDIFSTNRPNGRGGSIYRVRNPEHHKVDVLRTDGQVEAGATALFPAWSTSADFPFPNINSFDVGTGELSPLIDETGAGHYEVVACYPIRESGFGNSALYRMWVTVPDYTTVANGDSSDIGALFSHHA